MLARREGDRGVARDADGEHVFRIVGDAGRVAVAPGCVDLVDVRQMPVDEGDLVAVGDDARFFEQFAGRRFHQRFVGAVEGTGDGLPEAGTVGAFDQEHVQVGGVDDDQDGFGDFVGHDMIITCCPRPLNGPYTQLTEGSNNPVATCSYASLTLIRS